MFVLYLAVENQHTRPKVLQLASHCTRAVIHPTSWTVASCIGAWLELVSDKSPSLFVVYGYVSYRAAVMLCTICTMYTIKMHTNCLLYSCGKLGIVLFQPRNKHRSNLRYPFDFTILLEPCLVWAKIGGDHQWF